jgi:hypothetical protein
MPKDIEEYLNQKQWCAYREECCDNAKAACEKAKNLFNALPPNSSERRSAQDVYISLRKDYRDALEDYMDVIRCAKDAKTEAAIARVVARTPYDYWSLYFAFRHKAEPDLEWHKVLKANEVQRAIEEITEEYDSFDARGYDKFGYAEDGYNDLGITDGDIRGD